MKTLSQVRMREWLGIILIGLVVITGCGPAIPLENPKDTGKPPPENPAAANKKNPLFTQQLALRLIPSKEDRHLPDGSVCLKNPPPSEFGFQLGQNEIIFLNPISLKREFFFVWSGDLTDFSIQSVQTTHRALDGNNQWIGSPKEVIAYSDVMRKRWFIRISEVFSDRSSRLILADPSNRQVIRLELTLSNNKQTYVDIVFRVSI